MDLTGVIVALIGGATTVTVAVVAAWADLRQRTNGTGPLAQKLDELATRFDLRMDGVDTKLVLLDFRVNAIETRAQAKVRTDAVISEVHAVKDAVTT